MIKNTKKLSFFRSFANHDKWNNKRFRWDWTNFLFFIVLIIVLCFSFSNFFNFSLMTQWEKFLSSAVTFAEIFPSPIFHRGNIKLVAECRSLNRELREQNTKREAERERENQVHEPKMSKLERWKKCWKCLCSLQFQFVVWIATKLQLRDSLIPLSCLAASLCKWMDEEGKKERQKIASKAKRDARAQRNSNKLKTKKMRIVARSWECFLIFRLRNYAPHMCWLLISAFGTKNDVQNFLLTMMCSLTFRGGVHSKYFILWLNIFWINFVECNFSRF